MKLSSQTVGIEHEIKLEVGSERGYRVEHWNQTRGIQPDYSARRNHAKARQCRNSEKGKLFKTIISTVVLRGKHKAQYNLL